MKLSERIKAIKPSVTLAVTARAQAMRAQGVDVIHFAAGEPDFDTPQRIKDAAIRALEQGMTKYTDVRGIVSLREAVAKKYQRDYGLRYDKDEVLISCGGKHALYNIFQAILDQGDEIVIPAPYWVSYSDMALLAGAVPKIVPTDPAHGFRIRPDELQRALTPRTKAFVLNSPSNPTGAVYSRDELEALSAILERHPCFVVSDDVYEKIVYEDCRFHGILEVRPMLRERTIIVSAVSKTYAMTGWRIGYAVGAAAVISAAAKIQSQSTSNPTSIAQAAAVEALEGPQEEIEPMVREFQKRRDVIVRRLTQMDGIQCFKPQGAFYVFPNIRPFLGRKYKDKAIQSPCDLAEFLLEEARVAVVPGEDFGALENIRFTYACSLEDIEKGCDRIEEALGKLI